MIEIMRFLSRSSDTPQNNIEVKLDQLIALVPYDLKSEQGNQRDVRHKVINIMKMVPRRWRGIVRGVALALGKVSVILKCT